MVFERPNEISVPAGEIVAIHAALPNGALVKCFHRRIGESSLIQSSAWECMGRSSVEVRPVRRGWPLRHDQLIVGPNCRFQRFPICQVRCLRGIVDWLDASYVVGRWNRNRQRAHGIGIGRRHCGAGTVIECEVSGSSRLQRVGRYRCASKVVQIHCGRDGVF